MLNKVELIGHLGADPDLRYLPNGSPICNVSVATTRRWTDKSSNEKKEHTEWHRVIFFNRLAEVVSEYLHKGSKVYIEGRLQTRKWTDSNNVDRYSTEIIAGNMLMLSGKSAESGSVPDNTSSDSQPAPAGYDDVPF
jgi:single-strand DNA-binding protein